MSLHLGDEIELDIERLSYDGGRGVGRRDGMVVFVPFTAPGDRILARITEVKSSFAVAVNKKLLSPSPQRVDPQCPVYGRCGGCRWQHVHYAEQVRQKAEFIAHSLRKVFSGPIAVVSAPEPFRYRNRIQLHRRSGKVGYFAENSHDLVEIQDCPIADERLRPVIATLLGPEYADGKYELALTDAGPVVRDLKNEESQFTQVYHAQNAKLKELVFSYLENRRFAAIYDLYCGEGNFTFPLAYLFKQTPIWGVEANASAIVRAEAKARAAGVKHIQYRAQDVFAFLQSQPAKSDTLILVDPPRAGLSNGVIKEILRLAPRELIYISCHLPTLARDLEKLAGDYRVEQVRGVDMFPQTEYVETLSFLSHR